jgi:hypothetical protein
MVLQTRSRFSPISKIPSTKAITKQHFSIQRSFLIHLFAQLGENNVSLSLYERVYKHSPETEFENKIRSYKVTIKKCSNREKYC